MTLGNLRSRQVNNYGLVSAGTIRIRMSGKYVAMQLLTLLYRSQESRLLDQSPEFKVEMQVIGFR